MLNYTVILGYITLTNTIKIWDKLHYNSGVYYTENSSKVAELTLKYICTAGLVHTNSVRWSNTDKIKETPTEPIQRYESTSY